MCGFYSMVRKTKLFLTLPYITCLWVDFLLSPVGKLYIKQASRVLSGILVNVLRHMSTCKEDYKDNQQI